MNVSNKSGAAGTGWSLVDVTGAVTLPGGGTITVTPRALNAASGGFVHLAILTAGGGITGFDGTTFVVADVNDDFANILEVNMRNDTLYLEPKPGTTIVLQ